jgi:hypothetical protein
VDLLKEHPELRERLPQQAEKCVQVQLINLHHRGKREAALEISRLIASAQERENWLRRFGYWEELSQVSPRLSSSLALRKPSHGFIVGHVWSVRICRGGCSHCLQ